MNSRKILYFYPSWSTFVAKDVKILESCYRVVLFEFNPTKKIYTPFWFLKQLVFLFSEIRETNLFVSQFGGYHSILPALFAKFTKKPTLLIAGGTDCVAFPEISYGNLRRGLLGTATKWSHLLSSCIAPVDESLVFSHYTYQNGFSSLSQQGIKAHIPQIKTAIHVIYNGYNDFVTFSSNKIKTPNTFITIASGIDSKRRYVLKGVDLFVDLARNLPKSNFKIIGASNIPEKLPNNVTLVPFVKNEDLTKHLNESMFYVQLSLSEGFPNALCEAMLCECIPIVSNVASMPNIVGNNGIVISAKSSKKITAALSRYNHEKLITMGKNARKSILTRFPLDLRKKKLLVLTKMLQKHGDCN